jgi:hypothetical protein
MIKATDDERSTGTTKTVTKGCNQGSQPTQVGMIKEQTMRGPKSSQRAIEGARSRENKQPEIKGEIKEK